MNVFMKFAIVSISLSVTVPAFARTIVCTGQTTSTELIGFMNAGGELVSVKGQDSDGDLHLAGLKNSGPASSTSVKYEFRLEREDANCSLELQHPKSLDRALSFSTHLNCAGVSGGPSDEAMECTLQ